jgi:hypothetical protein
MAISLDKPTLEAALIGYQHQLRQLEAKMADVRQTLRGQGTTTPARRNAPAAKPARQKHQMSAEGRARIAAAQRARWAKLKKSK